MEAQSWIFYPVMFILIALAFKYTSIVVDEYIAEGITIISEALGFSESLAAVTLLAFANGAGDVITSIVASGSDGGVSYNIGALFGAGLFVCSLVVAICVLQNPDDLVFDKMIIYRDIGMYIVATAVTFLFGLYGQITWWTSVILLLLYIILVLIVIVGDAIAGNEIDEVFHELQEEDGLEEPLPNEDTTPEDMEKLKAANKANMKNKPNALFRSMVNKQRASLRVSDIGGKFDMHAVVKLAVANNNIAVFLREKLKMKHAAVEEHQHSTVGLISEIVDFPYVYILKLTCLPVNEEAYSRFWTVLYPVPGLFFIWFVLHPVFDMTYIYYVLPLGIILTIVMYFVLPSDGRPPRFMMLFTVLGVIAGLMWTYVIVEVLIDILDSFGILLNLDKAYLGLTILAVGNALPDALTTIALSA